MVEGRAFCILSGLLCLSYQMVGCSDSVSWASQRLGHLDTQQGWTVLVHEADRVESLDVATRKRTSIITANSPGETGSPGMASFSPDASEITFKEETKGGGDSLVVFNLKKRTRRVLLKMPYLDGPRWSPDGTAIAFEGRSAASGDYSLYRYTLNDEKLSTVIEGELKGGEMLFSWAPDGKSIVYQTEANDIYVVT